MDLQPHLRHHHHLLHLDLVVLRHHHLLLHLDLVVLRHHLLLHLDLGDHLLHQWVLHLHHLLQCIEEPHHHLLLQCVEEPHRHHLLLCVEEPHRHHFLLCLEVPHRHHLLQCVEEPLLLLRLLVAELLGDRRLHHLQAAVLLVHLPLLGQDLQVVDLLRLLDQDLLDLQILRVQEEGVVFHVQVWGLQLKKSLP